MKSTIRFLGAISLTPQSDLRRAHMQKDVEPTDAAHEAVRRRAYESYEQRGREDGHDWDDWIAAERELRGSAVAQGIEVQAEDARTNAGRRRPAKPPSGARSELAQG